MELVHASRDGLDLHVSLSAVQMVALGTVLAPQSCGMVHNAHVIRVGKGRTALFKCAHLFRWLHVLETELARRMARAFAIRIGLEQTALNL